MDDFFKMGNEEQETYLAQATQKKQQKPMQRGSLPLTVTIKAYTNFTPMGTKRI